MKVETEKEFLLKQYKQTFGTHYEQSSLKHLYEKVIIKAMIEYAELKCKEQDRNTRHNAAEMILFKTAGSNNPVVNDIAQKMHHEIMNLKSKTPDFE